MATIKQTAMEYSNAFGSICELDLISVEADIKRVTRNRKDGTAFNVNEIEVLGKTYRVPNSVVRDLKVIIQSKPDLKTFKVVKSGQGLATQYTVVPMQ